MTDHLKSVVREEEFPYWSSPPSFRVSESFEEFVQLNPDLRVEQNSNGEIVIMSPTGTESARRNASVSGQLWNWSSTCGGETFDSSVLFTLPDGSKRGPDASWISNQRWELIPKAERERFASICPDFVVELRSPTDRLSDLQTKMDEYVANGIQLGWLIDPFERTVHIYAPNQTTTILLEPSEVTGEPILLGFTLQMSDLWAQR